MNEEQFLRWQLAELQRAYQRDAKPIVDQLARIESRKPPPPFVMWMEDIDPEVLKRLQEHARGT